jgi:hypothetical protein
MIEYFGGAADMLARVEEFWRDLFDASFQRVDLGPSYMYGECGALFFHANSAVQALRQAIPIYNGDWSIVVRCVLRERFPDDFRTFIANCIASRGVAMVGQGNIFRLDETNLRMLPPPEHEVQDFFRDLDSQSSPVDLMWTTTVFGVFLWDWNKLTIREELEKNPARFGEIYGTDLAGNEFLPRVFLDVAPQTTSREVPELCKIALAALAELPDLAGGLPRSSVQTLIQRDMANLGDICTHAGTFGAAVLPGAQEPLLNAIPRAHNGNAKEVFAETSNYFYQFKCDTS